MKNNTAITIRSIWGSIVFVKINNKIYKAKLVTYKDRYFFTINNCEYELTHDSIRKAS